jgi:hypothetical protein
LGLYRTIPRQKAPIAAEFFVVVEGVFRQVTHPPAPERHLEKIVGALLLDIAISKATLAEDLALSIR